MRRRFASRLSSRSALGYAVASLLAAALAGCSLSYQLNGSDDTTGSIRPARPGQVDPNPNDPYRVETPGDSVPAAAAAKHAG
jgi:hypothetical protein